MSDIKRQYVITEDNTPIGVIIDLSTFERIESIIEDRSLAHYISQLPRPSDWSG